jgi:hypothetical protein
MENDAPLTASAYEQSYREMGGNYRAGENRVEFNTVHCCPEPEHVASPSRRAPLPSSHSSDCMHCTGQPYHL